MDEVEAPTARERKLLELLEYMLYLAESFSDDIGRTLNGLKADEVRQVLHQYGFEPYPLQSECERISRGEPMKWPS